MKPTAIYLIKSDLVEGVYKVGLSDAVVRRKSQIKKSYDLGGTILAEAWFPSRKAAQKGELLWHRFLSECRYSEAKGREWFELTEDCVRRFVTWSKISPNSLPLRMILKSGRYTEYQAEQLTNQLINNIPDGKQRCRSPV